jgi:hypothetical protein
MPSLPDRSSRSHPIWIELPALAPSQVTTTLPLPGRVEGPIAQFHETIPAESAVLDIKPPAVELVPAGVVYAIEHEVPGVVLATTAARPPGFAPVTDVIWTLPPGCGAAGAAGTRVAVATSGTVVAGTACGSC